VFCARYPNVCRAGAAGVAQYCRTNPGVCIGGATVVGAVVWGADQLGSVDFGSSPARTEVDNDPVTSPGAGIQVPSTTVPRPPPPGPPEPCVAPQGGAGDCQPCPVPQGTIGTYGALRAANAGHPECNAHHIIQHAAVREVSGYNRDAAPAIVLLGPSTAPGTPHYNATQAQRAASVCGSYGAERQVGVDALRAAGMPSPVVAAALQAADAYFKDELGLSNSSSLRTPGDRWGCG
jgi:hypothetical protein